ncbi:MAG: aminotransferase class V-fold PLP-dependent enzyme [Rhodothermales bacterium]|nr:aminotransferase class V-fold PLP-dependent enzyme [Rhodothermales bacterium]
MSTEAYFEPYRRNIVGHDQEFDTPYGRKRLIYADWIASGRLYGPIEERLAHTFGPFVGNTHSESSVTGTSMTHAYHEARAIIKRHVNAGPNDVIIAAGSGMTGVINKLQRILGLRVPERLMDQVTVPKAERPVVFLTHMEHHSNQTSWLETLADVEWLDPLPNGECCLQTLANATRKFAGRPLIGSFTACSNVTGVRTPYHKMARIMHEAGGLCFVDFAASAPYDPIDMHPGDPAERLDAIFFSPHKFLGGPGSAGIMVFDASLDRNRVPDHPGGGTVDWTNPWGEHRFVDNIEDREDGGTPGFLQTMRAALAIRVKEEIGCEAIHQREKELLDRAFEGMGAIPGLVILAEHLRDRLGVISFYLEGIHYNLVVKMLNDRFGIQVRGGCSCAGTYGHYLLHVDPEHSHSITERIDQGDLSAKPGWVRLSLHPTMTDAELDTVIEALGDIAENIESWEQDYRYDSHTNEYVHRNEVPLQVKPWFDLRSPVEAV